MMNKLRISLMSAALILGFALPVYADQVQGFVESVNVSDNSIVIMDPATGAEKTITVHSNIVASLKKGSVVKATFQPGSATVDTLEVLEAR